MDRFNVTSFIGCVAPAVGPVQADSLRYLAQAENLRYLAQADSQRYR